MQLWQKQITYTNIFATENKPLCSLHKDRSNRINEYLWKTRLFSRVSSSRYLATPSSHKSIIPLKGKNKYTPDLKVFSLLFVSNHCVFPTHKIAAKRWATYRRFFLTLFSLQKLSGISFKTPYCELKHDTVQIGKECLYE